MEALFSFKEMRKIRSRIFDLDNPTKGTNYANFYSTIDHPNV